MRELRVVGLLKYNECMSVTTEDLENFVVKCQPNLETIKANLEAFNIFNVLRVQHREIRHSNFLGWLFDPNESHNMGDVFLKELIKLLRKINLLEAHEYVELLLNELSNTQVYREEIEDIDILIVNEELGFVICIENKIHASYSDEQLRKYHSYVEKCYVHLPNRMYVTLTPMESYAHLKKELGNKYTNINYNDIVDIIKSNQTIVNNNVNSSVKESINQYVAMLEKDLLKNDPEVKLAQEIYKKYKKELKFIFANQFDFAVYQTVLDDFLNHKLGSFIRSHDSHSNVVHLLPNDKELLALFRFPEAKAWNGEYIFSLIIFLEKEEVVLKWGFGDIVASEEQEQIRTEKERLFNDMRNLRILNSNDSTKSGFKVSIEKGEESVSLIPYPKVGSVILFTEDDFKSQEGSFMEYFRERFNLLEEELIKPWIEECKAKLGKNKTQEMDTKIQY